MNSKIYALRVINYLNDFISRILTNPKIYRTEDYTKGLIKAMESTYLETIGKLNYPSVDSYYRYIKNADITIRSSHQNIKYITQ
ncbi:hypothetical protein MetfoDRAFT_1912 [Methanotorris formicicus Mc-S-70]|uniref:Uncharacterized protein n=1 Tax=Methanotorris formicicus Mc-S-70 TaxID=647171 RepID=H1L1I8_9EURY|nr:hypothetical protein MetfoDRAFT_1912 [Methanotorris formicicus Mc-S-70]